MSRRSTPERIDEARRAATRNRLIGEGVTEATADALIAAWAEQAERDGLERGRAYWGGRVGVDRRPAVASRAALAVAASEYSGCPRLRTSTPCDGVPNGVCGR